MIPGSSEKSYAKIPRFYKAFAVFFSQLINQYFHCCFFFFFSHLSAKYHGSNKEKLTKSLAKNIEAFSKKKNKKSSNMGVEDIKMFLKVKNKGYLSIEKKYFKICENKNASQIKTD